MSYISRIHDDLRRALLIRRNAEHKDKQVPMGLHKKYTRMEHFALPPPAALPMTLAEALGKRVSVQSPEPRALDLQTYGTLLGLALARHAGSHKRHYPSGGALYPIETYVLGAIAGKPLSAFHYDPTAHALELLWKVPDDMEFTDLFHNPGHETPPSALIVFTGVWGRSSAKYGDYAYVHGLLEAGHMSENILLTAAALGLAVCPLGGYDDRALTQLLDLDSEEEQPVHLIRVQ